MILLPAAAFSLSYHLLWRGGEQEGNKGHQHSQHFSTVHTAPRQPQEEPSPLQCPGQHPSPPALTLDRNLPPGHPWTPTSSRNSTDTAAPGERVWRWLLEPLAVPQSRSLCLGAALGPEIISHGQSSPHNLPTSVTASPHMSRDTDLIRRRWPCPCLPLLPPVLHEELLICYDPINAGTQTFEFESFTGSKAMKIRGQHR